VSRRDTLLPSVALTFATLMSGCGGGGGSSGGSTPPPVITVSVTPATSDVAFGTTQQFAAAVTGTANTAVTWSVSAPNISPVTGGNLQLGTITSGGLYTAPNPAPLPNPLSSMTPFAVSAGNSTKAGTLYLTPLIPSTTVTVTATSQADTTKSAFATVTIAPLSLFAVGTCTAATSGTTTCTAGSTGVSVNAGSIVTLFLVGEGVVQGTTFTISNPPRPNVTIVPGSVQYCTTQGTPSYPCASLQVYASPAAQPGPRNIMVSDPAGELAAFPGGLRICSTVTGACGQ
jgi:hypothetical protein